MVFSTLLFVGAVFFLAVVALAVREGCMEQLRQRRSPLSVANARTRRPRHLKRTVSGAPSFCYNDCVRTHEGSDPNFPCSVACGLENGHHS